MNVDEVSFRRPYGHAYAHATKDGEKTLCGKNITSIWAAVSEKDFKHDRPCKECKHALTRILRRGKQLKIW